MHARKCCTDPTAPTGCPATSLTRHVRYLCLFLDIAAVGLIVPLITPLSRELGATPKVSTSPAETG